MLVNTQLGQRMNTVQMRLTLKLLSLTSPVHQEVLFNIQKQHKIAFHFLGIHQIMMEAVKLADTLLKSVNLVLIVGDRAQVIVHDLRLLLVA